MTKEASLTPDEPYCPSMGNEADDRAILGATRPGSAWGVDPNRAACWEPPQERGGQSLLSPLGLNCWRGLRGHAQRLGGESDSRTRISNSWSLRRSCVS
jgi:hypothetical protein